MLSLGLLGPPRHLDFDSLTWCNSIKSKPRLQRSEELIFDSLIFCLRVTLSSLQVRLHGVRVLTLVVRLAFLVSSLLTQHLP